VFFTDDSQGDPLYPVHITGSQGGYSFRWSGKLGPWRCSLTFQDSGDPRDLSCSGGRDREPPDHVRLSCTHVRGARACGGDYAWKSFRTHLVLELTD
jgi:hypothetical protein